MQSNEAWMGKPILPAAQLEAALSRTSLALDEREVPNRQKAQKPPSIKIVGHPYPYEIGVSALIPLSPLRPLKRLRETS